MALTHARIDGARAPGWALAELRELPSEVIRRQAEVLLAEMVDLAWRYGWQPTELHRQGRMACTSASGGRLLAWAIAADHVGRRSVTLDFRWTAQVEALELPATDGRSGWVRRWAISEGLDGDRGVEAMVDALAILRGLPRLDPILPPPGSGGAHTGPARSQPTVGAEADPVLQRIRALLAQAESTTFEAEATTFTAKAQELMTRHAIDLAMVHGGDQGDDEEPILIRIPVDPPYADAKSLLLQTVAGAGRCRTVYMKALAMTTVIGFASDVAAVELLFTSLLLQAQRALDDAARRAPAGTRVRSQSYRSAFLLAYATRIGDRLEAINEAVYADVSAEQGSGFLPVLRSRADAVDEALSARFGELETRPRARWLGPSGLGQRAGGRRQRQAQLGRPDQLTVAPATLSAS